MNSGPKIPGWLAGVIAAIVVVILVVVGLKFVNGEGPRDPSSYPKEAFKPPAYNPAPGTYTKNGVAVGPNTGR